MNMGCCRDWAFKPSAKNDKLFIPGVLLPEHWNQYATLLLEVLHLSKANIQMYWIGRKEKTLFYLVEVNTRRHEIYSYNVQYLLFKILTLSLLMLVPFASLNYQETELATYGIFYLTYLYSNTVNPWYQHGGPLSNPPFPSAPHMIYDNLLL